MKKIANGCFILLAVVLAASGCSNNKAATPESSSSQPANPESSPASSAAASNGAADEQFVANAAKGNRAEVELGKMVAQKATSPAVKQFAQMMVKDHGAALNQLQQLAQSKNITLPEGLPDDAQQLQEKLSNERGKQLEQDYMSGMVDDHQKDVQDFKQASQDLKDSELKQWASTMLPKLQEHLQKAESVNAKISGGKSGKQSGTAPANPGE